MGSRKADSKVTEYARQVLDGKIVAGTLVISACSRHLSDLKRARSRTFTYRFDKALAASAIGFFSLLSLTKGKQFYGKPFKLELWQCFIVGSLFGWVEKGTGHRRFRYAYNEVARKNGKSELAAGIGLRLAFFDDEPGAEVYAFATKRDQAKIVWDVAKIMVSQNRNLRKYVKAFRLNMSSTAETNQKFEPLGADHSTLDGLNIHGAVIDELHAHKDRRLMDVIETATGARHQPLVFEITTAGEYTKTSICWQHRDYCSRILDGLIEDDRWFAYIATVDEGDRWDNPAVWPKANPNLGVSKNAEVMVAECKKAREVPSDENKFRRYHLDQWTMQAERWISMDVWNECAAVYGEDDLTGSRCFVGIDLASTVDINAMCLVFPDAGYKVLPYFWIPEDSVGKNEAYSQWIRHGFLHTTPGSVTDYTHILTRHRELRQRFDIAGTAIDEWNATFFATQLIDDGADVVLWKQNMAHMAPATKELERLIVQRAFAHPSNPVLSWMFNNVSIKTDSNDNMKIDRDKSRQKVDGIVAIVMAVGLAIKTRETGRSVYDERGILWV